MFSPNYRHVLDCAWNREPARLPMYEHVISTNKISELENVDLCALEKGNVADLHEFFRIYCNFFKKSGYDTVSYEKCISTAMPGSGTLGNPGKAPAIRDMEDFQKYPWEEIPHRFFEKYGRYFDILREEMPEGMKAVGGPGNGVFECVQDVTGYQNLCYISADDEELYQALFQKAGEINLKIWSRFLKEYGDIFCVLRFGDDLGYKSNTLLSTTDIRTLILPQYKAIIDLVHRYQKPFLLHSCGKIFSVMDDLIDYAGINAKHSNEDQIAPFPVWVEKYGDRIGNFGGLDMDMVCRSSKSELKEYTLDVINKSIHHGGFAVGTGNCIASYVPAENYLNLLEIIREYRGDFK